MSQKEGIDKQNLPVFFAFAHNATLGLKDRYAI